MPLPDPLITNTPDRLGGTPVFAGTRVPVQTFFEYIEGGETFETFLDHFPGVTRDHAMAVLVLPKAALIEQVTAAGVKAA